MKSYPVTIARSCGSRKATGIMFRILSYLLSLGLGIAAGILYGRSQ